MWKTTPRTLALVVSLFVCLLVSTERPAWAQTVPGSTDPGRISQKYHPPPLPEIAPPPQAQDTTTPPGDIAIAGADQVMFKFSGLNLVGMEAYPAGTFTSRFSPFVGKTVSLQQIINLINEIGRTYREDGYILSFISLPEQDITSGLVTVQVTEGRIARVMLDAPSQNSPYLKTYLDKIAAIQPFNIKQFEHGLLVMNTLSGSRFKSVLRAAEGPSPVSGVDVVILEEKEKPQTTLEINNFGSLYAGPWQAVLNTSFTHALIPYDRISLRASSTRPTREVKYGALDYEVPIFSFPGVSFKTGVNWGGTNSGSSLKEFDVSGLSREITAGITYNHRLSRKTNWASFLGLKLKDTRSKILGEELYDDRTRVVSAATTWEHMDDFEGTSLLTAELSRGFDVLGARESGSSHLSREDGRSDFTKITMQGTRMQRLPLHLEGLFTMSGQYSFTPVLSSEEFGFGGVPVGRGLDPSEITGDHGLSASLEIRYTGLPESNGFTAQPYSFLDFGKVWQKGETVGNAVTSFSTGFGTRFTYNRSTSIDDSIALPLTYEADNPPDYGNGGSPRFLISLRKTFN
jgi:hemolysin activation/secretion protein